MGGMTPKVPGIHTPVLRECIVPSIGHLRPPSSLRRILPCGDLVVPSHLPKTRDVNAVTHKGIAPQPTERIGHPSLSASYISYLSRPHLTANNSRPQNSNGRPIPLCTSDLSRPRTYRRRTLLPQNPTRSPRIPKLKHQYPASTEQKFCTEIYQRFGRSILRRRHLPSCALSRDRPNSHRRHETLILPTTNDAPPLLRDWN